MRQNIWNSWSIYREFKLWSTKTFCLLKKYGVIVVNSHPDPPRSVPLPMTEPPCPTSLPILLLLWPFDTLPPKILPFSPSPDSSLSSWSTSSLDLLTSRQPHLDFFVPHHPPLPHTPTPLIGVFTNSRQHKNDNIANFVLAMPLERNWTSKVYSLEMYSYCIPWYLISHLLTSYVANKEVNCKYKGIQSWQ